MSRYVAVWKPDAYHEEYEIFDGELSLWEFSIKMNKKIEDCKNYKYLKGYAPTNIRIFEIKKEVTAEYIK